VRWYRKKRKRRTDADKEEIVGETITRVMELLRAAGVPIPDGLCLTQTGNNGRGVEDLHIDEDQNDGPPPDEPDTIEQLTEPTKCSLVDCGGCDMELALATVYPNQ